MHYAENSEFRFSQLRRHLKLDLDIGFEDGKNMFANTVQTWFGLHIVVMITGIEL